MVSFRFDCYVRYSLTGRVNPRVISLESCVVRARSSDDVVVIGQYFDDNVRRSPYAFFEGEFH